MSIRARILVATIAITGLLGSYAYAQNGTQGKGMIFHGKVEAVTEKGLTVNGEKVEGWMDAMTMSYPVDKPEVLKKVKVGDTIVATVYKGEITLHNVEVVPPSKEEKPKSK